MASCIKQRNPYAPNWRTPPKPKRKPGMRTATPERARELQEYSIKRRNYLAGHAHCEFRGCYNRPFEIHHPAGREGALLNDWDNNFMALCRKHHKWIHDYPNSARELGYLK